MMRDNYPINENILLQARDFIPFYGLVRYVKRNEENRDIFSCILRESALSIYNILTASSLTIGLLEKLAN